MIMTENKKKPGAGVVLLQVQDGEVCVLGLCCSDEYFDLPKGGQEENESKIECAMRECWEETKITDAIFFEDIQPIHLSSLTLFVGTSAEDGTVTANPITGIIEHTYAQWLPLKSAAFFMKPYLRPAIRWAREIVEDWNLIEDLKHV